MPQAPTLTTPALTILIFYSVSGGPFGSEAAVKYAGPLYSLLGFALFPIFWSLPEALIVAELSTSFPENAGYVAWVKEAFGSRAALIEGFLSYLSSVTDQSLYPILFLKYLFNSTSFYGDFTSPLHRFLLLTIIIVILGFVNYRGTKFVTSTTTIILVLSLSPFLLLAILSLPKFTPTNLLVTAPPSYPINYSAFFNLLFWNLNYWDSISTLSGEVINPSTTIPRSLVFALLLVTLGYLLPLVTTLGASTAPFSDWDDGFYATYANEYGRWLSIWIVFAAGVSNIGLYATELTESANTLLGMAERGLLPDFFSRRSPYSTPTAGIITSSLFTVFFSVFDFSALIEMVNFLYIFAQLLEFAAFISLRINQPSLTRPFKIPLSTPLLIIMLTPPTLFMLWMLYMATALTWFLMGGMCSLGAILFVALDAARKRGWVKYSALLPLQTDDSEDDPLIEAT